MKTMTDVDIRAAIQQHIHKSMELLSIGSKNGYNAWPQVDKEIDKVMAILTAAVASAVEAHDKQLAQELLKAMKEEIKKIYGGL